MKQMLCVILLLLLVVVPLVVSAATAPATQAPGASASDAPAGDNGFSLQWYHYVIVSVIIFAMIFITSRTVGPANKK